MPKPKAPRWLTESFRDGVEMWRHIEVVEALEAGKRPGPQCWLAQHDPAGLPCGGQTRRLERFHFIPRQRVENALWALLPEEGQVFFRWLNQPDFRVAPFPTAVESEEYRFTGRAEIILLAAWDPRNGGIGCEHHHRRFDGHACSPQAPKIVVPRLALPTHVEDFIADYGLETTAEERFPETTEERTAA